MNIRIYPNGWDREPEFRMFVNTAPAHAYVHCINTKESNGKEKPPGSERLVSLFEEYALHNLSHTAMEGEGKLTEGHFVNYVDIQTGDTLGPFPLFL